MKIEMGEWAKTKQMYERIERERHKKWEVVEFKEFQPVMIIGIRTLNNGIMRYYYDEREYQPKTYFKALLVVKNMRENPYYIPMDSIKELD